METQNLSNPTSTVLSDEDKNWAMFAHLCTFIAAIIPMANVIGPIVIRMTRGKESAFVKNHANTVLNFQITFFLLAIVCIPVMLVPMIFIEKSGLFAIPMVIGVVAILAMAICSIVFSIIGAIRARDGREYSYPLSLRILK